MLIMSDEVFSVCYCTPVRKFQ